MFNLKEQVQKLTATPQSRLTKREILIVHHIISLEIQRLEGTVGDAIKELKRIKKKKDR